jgi:hypothetical protein
VSHAFWQFLRAILVLSAATTAYAQTGNISGTITDATGAGVPGLQRGRAS